MWRRADRGDTCENRDIRAKDASEHDFTAGRGIAGADADAVRIAAVDKYDAAIDYDVAAGVSPRTGRHPAAADAGRGKAGLSINHPAVDGDVSALYKLIGPSRSQAVSSASDTGGSGCASGIDDAAIDGDGAANTPKSATYAGAGGSTVARSDRDAAEVIVVDCLVCDYAFASNSCDFSAIDDDAVAILSKAASDSCCRTASGGIDGSAIDYDIAAITIAQGSYSTGSYSTGSYSSSMEPSNRSKRTSALDRQSLA